jgi:hypothetical protein
MDSLIEAIVESQTSKNMEEVSRIIDDIGTLTSGLNCAEIFKEQIASKAKSLSREDFLACSKFFEGFNCNESTKEFVITMRESFFSYEKNDKSIRGFFKKVFDIPKGKYSNAHSRVLEILSRPARTLGFPENYVALKELAQYAVKKTDNKELSEIRNVNVRKYPEGSQRNWASLCVEAAKVETAQRQKCIEDPKNKIGNKILKVAEMIKKLVGKEHGGVDCLVDQKAMQSLIGLLMPLSKEINSKCSEHVALIQDVVDDVLEDKPEVRKGVRDRGEEKTKNPGGWRREIKNQINLLNKIQIGKGKPAFDFNPNKIANPVSPESLVDMIFDASLQ